MCSFGQLNSIWFITTAFVVAIRLVEDVDAWKSCGVQDEQDASDKNSKHSFGKCLSGKRKDNIFPILDLPHVFANRILILELNMVFLKLRRLEGGKVGDTAKSSFFFSNLFIFCFFQESFKHARPLRNTCRLCSVQDA
jgi:hypothetical protein